LRFQIRQANVIPPLISADSDGMAAMVVSAEHQDPAHTGVAHFSDLLRTLHQRDQSISAARFIAADRILVLYLMAARAAKVSAIAPTFYRNDCLRTWFASHVAISFPENQPCA
jgi:hypothetical protein